MSNGTKILIGIILVVIIITGIIFFANNKISEIEKKMKNNNENIFAVIDENENKIENDISNEIEENNNTMKENTINKNTISNTVNTNQQEVAGKEEQESKQENTKMNDKETAIELAKKEWGIDVDSYEYETQLQNDGIYEVTVRSKIGNRDSVAIYIVNIITGAVTEK